MKLRSPLVPSASPLSVELDNLKRMEDAGAGAVVLQSLFEEQLASERIELHHHMTAGTESYAEALSYFPEPDEYRVGPEGYLNQIRSAKEALGIPVIASLNGATMGGWTDFARQMQDAGADALELNIYSIPTSPKVAGSTIEDGYVEIVKTVAKTVTIPVAVKLSPFFTNVAQVARRLDGAGARGLVLFNRFYQPDIDLESLSVEPNVLLSQPQALRLPMRWIAILHGRIEADLAATSGVHRAPDVIKMLMVGARVTQLCAALLRNGIDYLRDVEQGVRTWMEEHEYDSVAMMQGSMSQKNVADPSAFERAQYARALQSYRVMV
jgi:dihydroorotate dehydrogenase (fumarate)